MKPYQPSNGSALSSFTGAFCDTCQIERVFRESDGQRGVPCVLLTLTLIHDVGDPEYPQAWVEDDHGNPSCTAYVKALSAAELATNRLIEQYRKREEKGQQQLFGGDQRA